MAIASGVVAAWPSAAASIPAGWNRCAALDGYHVRGAAAGVDPGAAGGTATAHAHNSSGHTHGSGGAHSHLGSVSGAADTQIGTNTGGTGVLTSGYAFHTHAAGTTSTTDAGASNSTAASWAAASVNDPAFLAVVWIQSDGTPAGFPPYAVGYWNSATPPAGWTQHPAGKAAYLKGAATAADGGTTGGSNLHSHTGVAHVHTGASHSHTGGTVSATTTALAGVWGGATTSADNAHTHTISTNATTADLPAATSSASGLGSSEPPYRSLAIVQNSSGSNTWPANIIALWLGTLASIPSGWVLCNGGSSTPDLRGNFVRGCNLTSEIGNTGGGTTHTHTTGAGHTHAVSHTHIFTLASSGTSSGVAVSNTGTLQRADAQTHGHSGGATGVGSPATSASATQDVAVNTDESRPLFFDVAFIQYQASNSITVTTPTAAQVFALPSFIAAWTLTGLGTQASYRAVVYASDGTTIVYDSGTVSSATGSAVIPSGYLVNSTSYKFAVTITDVNGVTATSSQVAFSTSWTAAANASGLSAAPIGGT